MQREPAFGRFFFEVFAMKHICRPVCLVLILLLTTCQAIANGDGTVRKIGRRPNIVFILADDQAPFSIGAYGNGESSTPHIDRLAKMGMRLDGAYQMGAFQGAVCTASRHMIMSGRTLWHIPRARSRASVVAQLQRSKKGSTDRGSAKQLLNPNIPAGLENNTMAAVFNRAGYDTMRTCKRGNSYAAANRQFQVVHDATKRKGNSDDGSAWHGDRVMEFLSDRRQGSKRPDPFLIYLGFSHPHDPRVADDRLLNKYGAVNNLARESVLNSRLPSLPINYLPAHPFHHGHPSLRDEVAVQGVLKDRSELVVRNEKGREYACIENMDRQIGRVLSELEDMGELDNTYIVFTSDHGIAIGRHGLMGKQNLYEHSWRVPYIVAGPGIPKGSHAVGNVYLMDTLATLCDLAGVEPPATNEGHSFKPVLQGEVATLRDTLYGCYCGGTKPGMRAIRNGDWKLIRYESLDGKVKQTQLFNLAENPHELLSQHHDPEVIRLTGNRPMPHQTNLADHPKYAGQRKEMEQLLLSEMVRLHDPYRFDEGFMNVKPAPKGKRKKQQ